MQKQMVARRKRAAVFVGPEFGTVSRPDLVEAVREAADAGFDVLIACAFNYDAQASDFSQLGRVPILKARMNADLHQAQDFKKTDRANLFVVFGEPDIEIAPIDGKGERLQVKINGVDVYHPSTGEVPQRRGGRHRLLVRGYRLQPGEFLRPPRLLPRCQRPLQVLEDHAEGRDRTGRLGHPLQRHVASVRQP